MLSLNFIAGLVCGEGSFMWIKQNSRKIPVFQLKMHIRGNELVEAKRDSLGLSEPVHEYRHQNRHYALLLVRRKKQSDRKNYPPFGDKLFGFKKINLTFGLINLKMFSVKQF